MKISQQKVMYLHKIITDATGGDPSLREEGLLASALGSAYATFGGSELYPSLEEKAARLGHSLILNHAFVDGNKRIGMYVMTVFLEINGAPIRPSVADFSRVGLAVAAGEMKYEALLDWIRSNRAS